ncbi:hypothetical protein [Aquilutibacter rugosus]|uniref:hypothetical protein n=1 Tax=Aquilutibacter rugosus TaxID=3115820 RepID=UPI002F3F60CF
MNKEFLAKITSKPTPATFTYNGNEIAVQFKPVSQELLIRLSADLDLDTDESGKAKFKIQLDRIHSNHVIELQNVTLDENGKPLFDSYTELAELERDFVDALWDCYEQTKEKPEKK